MLQRTFPSNVQNQYVLLPDQDIASATTTTETKTAIQPPNLAISILDFPQERQEQKRKQPELEYETNLASIITSSDINDKNPKNRAQQILVKFNSRAKEAKVSIITDAGIRGGYRIEPSQFLVAHVNKVPELGMSFNGNRLIAAITGPYTESGVIGVVEQTAEFYGAHGSYVVNVPYGKYAKAWSGQKPLLLNEGVHVIHDPLFKFSKEFISQAENYISHGNLHILRVQPGKFAKVFIKGKAHLLEPREEPYVFDTALFQFEPKTDYVDQGEYYIQHGTRHILRVPAGLIAKVWVGSKPHLLESKQEPYVFDDPLFRLEKVKKGEETYLFESSTAKLIQHGSLKRIIPPINEVVITNNNGRLEIVDQAKLIDDKNHAIVGFLKTSLQTLEFPSAKTKEKRIKDNKDAKSDEINFEIFTTNDSVKMGVKLLVTYRVADAQKALTKLESLDGILEHIEGVVTSDMGKAIQECSSNDFLKSFRSKHSIKSEDKSADNFPSAPVAESSQDRVQAQLKEELAEYGIELVRMNVQESKTLDSNLAAKMAEGALTTARASAEQAALEQNYNIARTRADQAATVQAIEAKQRNANLVAAAQAELDAAKLKAQAKIAESKAITDAANAAAELQGALFAKYPQLLEFELAKLKFAALSRVNFSVTSPEFANMFGAPALSLFSGNGNRAVLPIHLNAEEQKSAAPAASQPVLNRTEDQRENAAASALQMR